MRSGRKAAGAREAPSDPPEGPTSPAGAAERLSALEAAAAQRLELAQRQLERERARAANAEREMARLRTLLAAREAELDAVMRSVSWRLTRPFRVLARLLTGKVRPGAVADRVSPGMAARLRRLLARLKSPPARRADPLRRRPEPPVVRFPLEGAIAAPVELTGETPQVLPVAVSVVVPTYNAGHEFYWLLRKLKAQQGLARVEVVVVDSGSSDGTPELAEQMGCTVVRIPSEAFSHSYARNTGADHATGDFFLFTVQDAYPVGDWWLHSLVRALTAPADPSVELAAVSSAEFPRVDSELLYNAAVDVHSRFLGCRARDRVGAWTGDDHMALRTQGQVSDLACMIPAETFRRYRYEGRYAEDLFLGIRLIRDGLKAAMLSSVKVIHSHNRPAAYHLKRTFVDVVVLCEGFPDFQAPATRTVIGTLMAGFALDRLIAEWRPKKDEAAGAALARMADLAREASVDGRGVVSPIDFGVPGLTDWLKRAAALEVADATSDVAELRTMFADRLGAVADFAAGAYGVVDDYLEGEIRSAMLKTLAASIGAQLAFYYLHRSAGAEPAERPALEDLRAVMFAGV